MFIHHLYYTDGLFVRKQYYPVMIIFMDIKKGNHKFCAVFLVYVPNICIPLC